MLAISSCGRTCLRVFMDRESLRENVTADGDGKSLSPEGGEKKNGRRSRQEAVT